MTRHLPAALLALAACSTEPVTVPVSLAVDSDTCATTVPEQVVITCAATVGVWVRDSETTAILDQACQDLPAPSSSLADLPQALSSIALDEVGEGAVYIDLAIHSPATAADGCPTVDDFASELIVYGSTSTAILSDSSTLRLELQCWNVDVGDVEICEAGCDSQLESCTPEEMPTCDETYDECIAICDEGDQDCLDNCTLDYEACRASDECEVALDACLDNCLATGGGLDCDSACYDEHESCLAARPDSCQVEYSDCITSCSDGDVEYCASVQ